MKIPGSEHLAEYTNEGPAEPTRVNGAEGPRRRGPGGVRIILKVVSRKELAGSNFWTVEKLLYNDSYFSVSLHVSCYSLFPLYYGKERNDTEEDSRMEASVQIEI